MTLSLDLVLDAAAYSRLRSVAILSAITLRGEIDIAAGILSRHDLALGLKNLSEKGLSSRNVGPGQLPPGAFSSRRPAVCRHGP